MSNIKLCEKKNTWPWFDLLYSVIKWLFTTALPLNNFVRLRCVVFVNVLKKFY